MLSFVDEVDKITHLQQDSPSGGGDENCAGAKGCV